MPSLWCHCLGQLMVSLHPHCLWCAHHTTPPHSAAYTDYVGLNDSVAMFGVGDNTSTTAIIIIVDDSVLEGNEHFTLLADVVGESAVFVEVVPPTQPTVTIVDDDGMCAAEGGLSELGNSGGPRGTCYIMCLEQSITDNDIHYLS